MTRIRAIIIAAQDEEVRPVLDEFTARATRPVRYSCPIAPAWIAANTHGNVLILTTGIGQAATSSVLSWALTKFNPKIVVSTGSAGGLAKDIKVGDVVVGTSYAYGTADATVFGYERGQVPGQPATFPGAVELIEAASLDTRQGLMLSGDSFITAHNVADMRTAFPEALTTDMESAAAAQVCRTWGIPFISVRCVSDLCGPEAQDDYSMALDQAARRAAETVATLLLRISSRGSIGPSQRFSEDALTAALLYVFAKVQDLPPGEAAHVPAEIAKEIPRHMPPGYEDRHVHVSQLVDSAIKAIAADSSLTMTAKQYDEQRQRLADQFGVNTGRGQLHWPPTSQTIIKRFGGYWNEALEHVGMSVQSGRKRGGLKFSDHDYVNALRNFATWSAKRGSVPSYKAYQAWVKECGHGQAPSGAAIRQRFGSWRAATQQAQI